MKHLATVFALSASVLLFGCGGPPAPSPIISHPTSSTSPPPVTPPPIPNVAGNWQFSATSTVMGKPPLTFAGSLSQADSTVSGALHVDGSNCFNQLTTMGLTGTVTADSTSLTSTAINGQVVTFTGHFTNSTFTGTYSVNGGCAAGDQGSVNGVAVYLAAADSWGGTFTSSDQKTFNVSGDFAQSTTPSSAGSFGITGTATFDTPCFSAATISPGSFPSGSFVLGTLVSLEIKTDNGTVTFIGTADVSPVTGVIRGSYNVSGGTCDQTGTAVVVLTGQWDY
jgi:hypothetical protein